jgi:hypothetical protein
MQERKEKGRGMIPATNSIPRLDAKSPTASGSTPAVDVKKKAMDDRAAPKPSRWLMVPRPKYMRYNRWNVEGEPVSGVVEWTEAEAKPLPKLPRLSTNHPVARTVASHASLFQITTPIHVDLFRELLIDHPNFELVESVCDGLESGFWPWAKIDQPGYPPINDCAQLPINDPAKEAFLREQRDKEIAKGCFSNGFRGNLSPGMYCMPIFAVPKVEPGDFRLVTHQSFGKYSLNSLTPVHEHSFPLNNLVQLGDQLLRAHRLKGPNDRLTLWKSDVADTDYSQCIHIGRSNRLIR